MEKINYKVAANGHISVHCGKKKLSAPWGEVKVAPAARQALREQLDPVMVRAAWAIFGHRCLPADLNELLRFKSVVRQVMADSPKLAAPIYFTLQRGDLKQSPTHSVVKRFKDLMMRVGYQPVKCVGGVTYAGLASDGTKRRKTDVNRYWWSAEKAAALSEAGWRYLLRLTYPVLRSLVEPYYAFPEYFAALNLLGALDAPPVAKEALEALALVTVDDRVEAKEAHAFALAVRDVYAEGSRITPEEVDAVRDWVRSDAFTLNHGTAWHTIVERAIAYAMVQAEKKRAEMAAYRWQPPIAPFVANDGLVVTPLSSGVELLEEGIAQQNCLRQMGSYARRAVEGASQVFSIKGIAGRATVEFTRCGNGAWRREQAVEKYNKPISQPALLRAVNLLGARLNGEGA